MAPAQITTENRTAKQMTGVESRRLAAALLDLAWDPAFDALVTSKLIDIEPVGKQTLIAA